MAKKPSKKHDILDGMSRKPRKTAKRTPQPVVPEDTISPDEHDAKWVVTRPGLVVFGIVCGTIGFILGYLAAI